MIKLDSIKNTRENLKNKKASSAELVKLCLKSIKEKDGKLNSFITVCEKEALEEAKTADQKIKDGSNLPLLGIPIALKDIFLTKGIKTTAASKVLENYIPQYDGTVVKKLKDAGAVIIGKTNCDAWAHGSSGENSDFGPTKNPFNTNYVPGGSSSGSAVAVASGFALAATGTDTGGSIRLPSSFCNVVGLKPTYGRVSRYGIVAMASSLDSIGHFTNTVEDSALLLEITAGRDKYDATTPEVRVPAYSKNLNSSKKIRIGIPKEYIEGIDKEIEKSFQSSVKVLNKLGFEITEISLPNTKYSIPCYYVIQPSEVSSNLARYDGIRYGMDRNAFGDEAKRRIMLGTFTLSSGYYDAYYKTAMKVRTLISRDFDEAFQETDVIVAPVSPTMPWKLREKLNDPLKMYLSDVLSAPANLAGIPGLTVPAGFENNLPIGIQILGPQFSEEILFQVGHAFEKETLFYKNKPKL